MYKVPISVLNECKESLESMVTYLDKEEKIHYQESKSKDHIYKKVLRAKKLIKMLKLNYDV